MKIRNKNAFFEYLDKDMSNRQHELSNIKEMVFNAKREINIKILIKSAILILYSHWEGSVKNITKIYFYYLNSQGMKYRDLHNNYLTFGMINKYSTDLTSRKFNDVKSVVSYLKNDINDEKFYVNVSNYVKTNGNLNTEAITDLSDKIGICTNGFYSKKTIIDYRLLKSRNSISHGDSSAFFDDYTKDDYIDLHDKIVELMIYFKSLVTNFVAMESYKNKVNTNT